MKIEIYDAIFYMNQAKSLDELTHTFERVLSGYGFDQFAVQFTPLENKKPGKKPYALATFNQEWVNYYKEEGFHTIDPVVVLGTTKRKPFLWNNLWDGISMSKKQQQFFNEAGEYGVGTGVGLPIPIFANDPGVVSLVSSFYNPAELSKIVANDHLELMLLSTNLQYAVSKFVEQQESPDAPHLTSREKECLTWVAVGKTDYEIGRILGISTRTVHAHLNACYRKLNCVTRQQAAIAAIMMRIITP